MSKFVGEIMPDGQVLVPPSRTSMQMVEEFHEAFGLGASPEPNIEDTKLNTLRVGLLEEEVQELKDALAEGNAVATLDALTDIQYVLDGAYLQLGFARYKDEAIAEVHRSNMTKLGEDGKPIYRESDGKVMKGPNYETPNLGAILAHAT